MAHRQVMFRSEARGKGSARCGQAGRCYSGDARAEVEIRSIARKWGAPLVCNDGVTIAKEFDLKDPEENLGAQMLRQASEKTGESVGTAPARRRSPRMRSMPRS